jgi:hypothetical protein
MKNITSKLPELFTLLPAIIAASMLLILDLYQGLSVATHLAGIIFILGVLAIGQLAERLSFFERIENKVDEIAFNVTTPMSFLERIENKVDEIAFNVTTPAEAIQLQRPTSYEDLEEYFKSATEICVSGGSFAAMVPRYTAGTFKDMAARGCKFRFVLLNPDSPVINQVATWANRQFFEGEIRNSLSLLKVLRKNYPDSVEIRLNNTIPALTFLGIQFATKSLIRLDLNLYQCAPKDRLYFEIASDNPTQQFWHAEFKKQFELLWEQSKEWGGNPRQNQNMLKWRIPFLSR